MTHVKSDEFFVISESQILEDLLVILPKNDDEAAFQPNILPSTQNHEFLYFTAPTQQPIEPPTSSPYKCENLQPTIAETWQQSSIQATTTVTSQPSDMQSRTMAESQALDMKPITATSQLMSHSSDESQGTASPAETTMVSNVRNPTQSSFESYLCSICGDRATGKHYGAISCDGCKGFFRRSVRKNQEYACRFKRGCVVTREKRNQCRYCRLRKCFTAGMKKEAVQNERDRISYRRSSQKQNQDASTELTITNLLRAEEQDQMLEAALAVEQVASITDICNSMQDELLHFVGWAKKLPQFVNLSLQDRVTLLKTSGAEHLILGVARRSLNRHDSLLLANKSVILKDLSNTESVQNDEIKKTMQNKITIISKRIFKELIQPWKSTKIDDVEFACLKTIVFFNPNAEGLVDTGRVETLRNEVQIKLENYISDRQYEGVGRLGKLLLTLPSLHSISKEMTDDILFAEIFYGLQIDDVLREILLHGINKLHQVL